MKPVPTSPRLAATSMRLWRDIAIGVVLVLFTFAVFSRALQAGFVDFDDATYVEENPEVLSGLSLDNAAWAFTSFYAANWHPLSWLSLQLDVTLFGPQPWGMHLTNIVIHALSVGVLFVGLLVLTGERWPSAMVAALFAVHPLRVESVVWISERKDVLSAFFWMLTLLAYGWYAHRPTVSRMTWVIVAFILGLLAKPMLVTLPCVLLLLDYWPLGRWTNWRCTKALVIEKLPLFVLAGVSSYVTFLAQKAGGAVASTEQYSLLVRVANAAYAYVAYLAMAVWPVNLAPYYPHPGNSLSWITALSSIVVLVLISCVAVTWARKAPYVLVGWLWYLGTLVPVIGLVQVGNQAFADRYTYIPEIGLAVAVVWGTRGVVREYSQRRPGMNTAAWCGAMGVVLLLSVQTWRQTGWWLTRPDIWQRVLDMDPSSTLARVALGKALLAQARYEEAKQHFLIALASEPDNAEANLHLGAVCVAAGDFAEGERLYRLALAPEPNFAIGQHNLGGLLLQQGRTDEAKEHLQIALDLNNRYTSAWRLLGLAEARSGNDEAAIRCFHRALELVPNSAPLYIALGSALDRLGQHAEAMANYQRATQFDPTWIEVMNRNARVLAVRPEFKRREVATAVEMALHVVRATEHRNPDYLATLAAACASEGDFTHAQQTAEEAREVALRLGNKPMAQMLEGHLKTYQQNKRLELPK